MFTGGLFRESTGNIDMAGCKIHSRRHPVTPPEKVFGPPKRAKWDDPPSNPSPFFEPARHQIKHDPVSGINFHSLSGDITSSENEENTDMTFHYSPEI